LQARTKQGFPRGQIEVVIGWLIKGQYVVLDPAAMTIQTPKGRQQIVHLLAGKTFKNGTLQDAA